MKIRVENILDLIKLTDESFVQSKLSSFSCEKNAEIEEFLKKDAIQFAKKGISVTYLVFGSDEEATNQLLGYFTLTYKIIQINKKNISSRTNEKIIARFGDFDKTDNSYTIPAPLIAQFGKNSDPLPRTGCKISGEELMKLALEEIRDIQHRVGGRLVYLECEDVPKLLEFYDKNNFEKFSERIAQTDGNPTLYHRLLKILK